MTPLPLLAEIAPLPGGWRLRPVTGADEPLLRRIHAGTRQAELDASDWSETQRAQFLDLQFRAQRSHDEAHHPGAEHTVVETSLDLQAWAAAGRLRLHRRPDALHVLDIALLPECRGRGLGTRVLRSVMARAAASGRVVSIHIEQGNPARRLCERLGFVPVGPLVGIHQRMAWRAAPQRQRQACDEQA